MDVPFRRRLRRFAAAFPGSASAMKTCLFALAAAAAAPAPAPDGPPPAARLIPGARLVAFPDLGHAPQIQDPGAFHTALLEGLEEPGKDRM